MTSGYRTIAERIDFMSRRHTDRDRELIELERHMVDAEIDRMRALNAIIAAIGIRATAERFDVSDRTVRRWRTSLLNKIGQKMSA